MSKQLEAENLKMREAWKYTAKDGDGYMHDCPCRGRVKQFLEELPYTAHLARRVELMEKVCNRYRYARCFHIGVDEALKELDDHEAKLKEE